MKKPPPHSNILRAVILVPCCLLPDQTLCPTTKSIIQLAINLVKEPQDIEKTLFMITSGSSNLIGLARSRICTQTSLELSEICMNAGKIGRLPHVDCLHSDSPLAEIQEVVTMLRRVYKSVEKIDVFCQASAYKLVHSRWNAMVRRAGKWREVSVQFNRVDYHG